MKNPYQHHSLSIGLVLCAMFLWTGAADANLTAQSSSGIVEVLLAGEQTWQALTASTKLNVGDQVRTGDNSAVDLWFEDGSVLNLAEGTQLAVTELNISTAQKTRTVRFKLWWGAVTVKITKLAFTENLCEIETDSVVASVTFAEMTVKHPQNSPQSEIIASQGQIMVRRLAAADDRIVKLIGYLTEREGVSFLLPPAVGVEVFLSIQKILGTMEVQSPSALTDIRPLFDALSNFVKIDNKSQAVVFIHVGGSLSLLEAQGSATIGIPPNEEMLITAQDETDLAFSIKRRTAAILCEGLYVFLNGGSLSVNDEEVLSGVPNCFPVLLASQPPSEGRGRSVIQTEAPMATRAGVSDEIPVIPVAPQSQSPQTIVVEPTPVPTATPTPTPTEEPDEPTPTPTVTPTVTPTPTPTRTPRPTPPPPPPPTPTPASPIQP